MLAVLDPRLRTKGYGRRFIASLPPAPVVHDLEAVEALLFDRVRYVRLSSYCHFLQEEFMVRRISGRPSWLFAAALVASLVAAVPAFAQSTGMVKGVVIDDKGQPVADAKVTIEMNGGTGRKFETKTNKKGEYIQIGLGSGSYKVTAEKDKLGFGSGHRGGARERDRRKRT